MATAYADLAKKAGAKDPSAKKVADVAKELDASRAKGAKDPIRHLPVHTKLLAAKAKELQTLQKGLPKDAPKEIAKTIDEMLAEIKKRIQMLSAKPKVNKSVK